jgi:hypothetical protein
MNGPIRSRSSAELAVDGGGRGPAVVFHLNLGSIREAGDEGERPWSQREGRSFVRY